MTRATRVVVKETATNFFILKYYLCVLPYRSSSVSFGNIDLFFTSDFFVFFLFELCFINDSSFLFQIYSVKGNEKENINKTIIKVLHIHTSRYKTTLTS